MNAQSDTTKDQSVITSARSVKQSLRVLKTFVVCICLLTGIAGAQSSGAYSYFARAGWVCGAGASNSPVVTKPTVQCGGMFSGPFFDLEVGVMGPQANQSTVSGYLSTNLFIPLIPLNDLGNRHGVPLFVGGYTNMFETGNALDYGLAFAHPIDRSHSIQFEVRDYCAFSNPTQHNVVFRIAWLTGLAD
jgi:hypothetical protein